MKKKPSLLSFANVVASLLLGVGACAHAQDAKPGDAAAGAKKAEMCNGCHSIPGYQASFPEVYKVPKIAGQGSKYLVTALTAYRKGERKHPTMLSISSGESVGDEPGLWSVAIAIGTPAVRNAATGGSLVSRRK